MLSSKAGVVGATVPGLDRGAATYLLVGALGIAVFAILPRGPAADLLFIALSGSATAAVGLSARRRRPIARRAWLAVAVSLGMLTAANALVAASVFEPLAPLRSLAEVMFMAVYLPLFLAAFLFARGTHRSDRTAILDTAIVALAAIPVVWVLLIEPHVPVDVSGAEAMMSVALPVIDILLVSLVAPLMLLRFSRSPSAALLVGAFTLTAVGDSLYAVAALDPAWSMISVANVVWPAAYVMFGAAALVRSGHDLGAVKDPKSGSRDRGRLVILAVSLLAPALVTIRETAGESNGELLMFAVLSLVITMLVVLRLQRTLLQLTAVDQRFRRFMSHAAFRAVIKDVRGRYIYVNSSAQRGLRQPDDAWYGRSDADLYPADVAARQLEADAQIRRSGGTIVGTVEDAGRTWHTERFAMPETSGEVGVLGVDITDRVRAEAEVRFQARLLESVQDAVIVVATDRTIAYWNHGATAIFGFTAEEMVGETMSRLIEPGTEAEVAQLWTRVGGAADAGDWRAIRRDGSRVWVNVRVGPISDDGGQFIGHLGVAKDVTARKETELELARLGAAIGNATDAVIVTDGDDRVVYVNPAFERMTGFASAEVRGRRPMDEPTGRAFGRALALAQTSSQGWRGDIIDRRRDGSDLISETSISRIEVDGQPSAGYVTIRRDVTRERVAERGADRRARERLLIAETLGSLHGGLSPEATGAAVCRQLTKLPEVAIATVVTFDIDDVATVIAQAERSGDGLAGIPIPAERSAYLLARAAGGPWVERWMSQQVHPYSARLDDLGVMAHAYAPIGPDGNPIGVLIVGSDLIDAVDQMTERLPALVEFAAITGTLLVGAVADRMQSAARRAELRSIVDRRAFHPVFQPIVELSSGEILGYEALTRFDDETSPDTRFQQARELGLSIELEAACLVAAFAAATGLPAGKWLNVNVSPELVLAGLIEGLLPDESREIVLEITEHEAISDYVMFREAVAPLRRRVKLAVDDAGAGFSSLRHIVELAPSMVKLDRSLVEGIGDDTSRQAVVAGMVQFAQAASLTLLAEGIETEDEVAALRRLGVQLGQGYMLGRPQRVEAARMARRGGDSAAGASGHAPLPRRRSVRSAGTAVVKA